MERFTVAAEIGRNAVNVPIIHGIHWVTDATVGADINTHMKMIIAEFPEVRSKLLASIGRPNVILTKDHTRDND
jgi:hypothetical protein